MSNVVHNQWLKFKFWTPLQKKNWAASCRWQ